MIVNPGLARKVYSGISSSKLLIKTVVIVVALITLVPAFAFGSFGINVTDPPYNADNTGATDASVAIQSAQDAVGNGVLFFPKGVYKITNTLNKHTGSTWIGEGKGGFRGYQEPETYTTKFEYYGSVGGTMINYSAISGPDQPNLTGGGIIGIVTFPPKTEPLQT